MEEQLHSGLSNTGSPPLGSLENPIRVHGISGEFNYLQRLFTLAREPFFFHRLGSVTRDGKDPVDIYELIAQDNSERWVLAISHYHRTTSDEAPEGLWLDPKGPYWGTTIGVNSFLDDFPSGLLAVWTDKNPSLAEFIEWLLSKFKPEEWRTQPFQRLLAPPPCGLANEGEESPAPF